MHSVTINPSNLLHIILQKLHQGTDRIFSQSLPGETPDAPSFNCPPALLLRSISSKLTAKAANANTNREFGQSLALNLFQYFKTEYHHPQEKFIGLHD